MARIRGHRNLNEDKPLYVIRRELTVDGETFAVGEEFPWRRLGGVTPRLVRMLHGQRRISHDKDDVRQLGAEDPGRSPQEQRRAAERDQKRAAAKAAAAKKSPAPAAK